MNRVRVETPHVIGDTLVGEVSATGAVSRFFSGQPFRATYSTSIEDVPDPIRTIPVLAHVCPVAWATDATVVVDTVDARFLDALRSIRATLVEFYPEFMTGRSVFSPDPVTVEQDTGTFDGTGMLFTGGVDSMATYVRHREESPTLISVQGWEIGEREREQWTAAREYVTSFASERDVDAQFVESNMLTFLASPLLQAHFQQYLDGAWYSAVGHGLGLLGLCAPLASAEELGRLYIAATHTADWQRPWGSSPEIDDQVTWSDTSAVHDGYDASRQDKLESIAAYVQSTGDTVTVRTCAYDEAAGNCNDCEKCYRTIVGLLLAGLDPNEHGYDVGPEPFDRITSHFRSDDLYLSPQTRYHWEVLQAAARDGSIDQYAEGDAFLEWLERQDLRTHVRDSERSLTHRMTQRIARNTPTTVYSALYPIYRRVADTPH